MNSDRSIDFGRCAPRLQPNTKDEAHSHFHTESAYIELQQKYDYIFNDPETIILLLNAKTLLIIEANEAAAKFYGIETESLLGRKITELYSYEEAIILHGVEKILTYGQYQFSFHDQRSDGKLYDISATASSLRLQNSVFIYIFMHNISKRMITENRLRALTLWKCQIVEQERKRLAFYLHDDTSQNLVSLKMCIDSMLASPDKNDYQAQLSQISDSIKQMIQSTQSMIIDFYPITLYKFGIVKGLKYEGEMISKKYGLRFYFHDLTNQVFLDEDRKVLLFRSVQELMRNVVKHARATEMSLSIKNISPLLSIILCDNGKGFDPSILDMNKEASHGFGLFSIKEELASIQGTLSIASRIGIGTSITIEVLCK